MTVATLSNGESAAPSSVVNADNDHPQPAPTTVDNGHHIQQHGSTPKPLFNDDSSEFTLPLPLLTLVLMTMTYSQYPSPSLMMMPASPSTHVPKHINMKLGCAQFESHS